MVRYENVRVADSKESQSNRALNKIFSCYSRQQNAMTHIPRNLPHYNLQQGSKCSASFRWGVGFGYRLKSAAFLRDHIRHDQLYAAVARPVTCNIRWWFVVIGRRRPDAARGRGTATHRRSVCWLYRGSARTRSAHAHSAPPHP